MSSQIATTVEIDATPERVWKVLTDFGAYPEWNPFITRIAGPLQAGGQLDVYLKPSGGRGMGFK